MLKKAILFLVCFFSFHSFIHAQSFLHGIGANVSVMTANIKEGGDRYTMTMSFTNLTYFPRYILSESDNSSLTIGAPVGAGIGFANSGGTDAALYYGFDLPLALDYNIGRKSSYENNEGFGWYVGGGFGYMWTNWTDGSSTDKISSFGPMARAGIRFGSGSQNPDRALTLGFSFKPGLEKRKFKTFGIAVLYEL